MAVMILVLVGYSHLATHVVAAVISVPRVVLVGMAAHVAPTHVVFGSLAFLTLVLHRFFVFAATVWSRLLILVVGAWSILADGVFSRSCCL